MSISEEHTTGSKPVQIWSACLRMPSQTANPIIQIVDGYKEYIGLGRMERNGQEKK